MSLEIKQIALQNAFAELPDDEERLRQLIQWGRRVPALSAHEKTSQRLLPGCISSLWLLPDFAEGVCRFRFDADAQIVRGVAALVCGFYDGETPEAIVACPPDVLEQLGVRQLLTSNRSNSLSTLSHRIRAFAQLQLKPL
jgi:cysteine desulfuration protein SufE